MGGLCFALLLETEHYTKETSFFAPVLVTVLVFPDVERAAPGRGLHYRRGLSHRVHKYILLKVWNATGKVTYSEPTHPLKFTRKTMAGSTTATLQRHPRLEVVGLSA
jgi:hypothetical protein